MDVHARHYEVDEPLESGLLIHAGQRPVGSVGLGTGWVLEGVSEQEFQPALVDERIALKIQEDIAIGESRESGYRDRLRRKNRIGPF